MSRTVLAALAVLLLPLPARQEEAASGSAASGHWAFRPISTPAVPEPRDAARSRNEIDRFILAKLEERGLTLGPEADRAALLRRVSFDLTGLPPGPDEIAAFLDDPAPDAYERMIERFLSSPRYGERWGRHWLDAAGYADSNGYFDADTERPLAYRYRDYVLRSFNEDKPLDRFIQEQIAGDEIAGYVPGGDITPEMVEPLEATHFLRNAPDGTGESDGNPDEQRADRLRVIEGTVQIIGTALLGMTFQCARCHDHKFEPITQEEYYGFQAIFYPAYDPDRWLKPKERVVEAGTVAEREAHRKRSEEIAARIEAQKRKIEEAAAPLRRRAIEENLAALEGPLRERILAALDRKDKERSAEEKRLLEEHKGRIEVPDDDLAKRHGDFAALRAAARGEIAAAEKEMPPPLPRISILTEQHPDPPAHHVFIRGDYKALGKTVEPTVPAALCGSAGGLAIEAPFPGKVSSGRRSALARWLTAPGNPLPARVLSNRIWQRHFGAGLVATPGNLGRRGSPPTHPELLDWLAGELQRGGWSLKAINRLILRSAVYRQSSAAREEGLREDPENRLLWRFPLLRLDAESIRDAMLCAAGELDLRMGGPFVPTRLEADLQVTVDEGTDGAMRRSLYLRQRRTQVLTLLDLFDCPRVVTSVPRRAVSTIPLQSLALLNSGFAIARARALARRIAREAGPAEWIERAFLLAAGRPPEAAERAAAEEFLKEQPGLYGGQEDAGERGLADFCQMLLASNAFLYVE